MKLMFASDIHGSLPATERVLERFAQSGARWLIILGDVLNHGPRNALPEGYAPAEVAERLNSVAERIIAVRGNCDSEVDQMLLRFPMTAPWQQVLSERYRLFLTHGHLYSPEICRRWPLAMSWLMAILIFRLRKNAGDLPV
jgi:putative phosphoesterase